MVLKDKELELLFAYRVLTPNEQRAILLSVLSLSQDRRLALPQNVVRLPRNTS